MLDLNVESRGEPVARFSRFIALVGNSIAPACSLVADARALRTCLRNFVSLERALRPCAPTARIVTHMLAAGITPVDYRLVTIGRPLVAIRRQLVPLRRALVAVRRRLVEIRVGLIGIRRDLVAIGERLSTRLELDPRGMASGDGAASFWVNRTSRHLCLPEWPSAPGDRRLIVRMALSSLRRNYP